MGKKKAAPSKSQNPQRRKDPVFIKNVGSALETELRKRRTAPAATKDVVPTKVNPKVENPTDGSPKAKPRLSKGKDGFRTSSDDKKAVKKTGSDLEKLRKELRSLIPALDTEGLSFLIEQARVHLYNMKVTELETAAQDLGKHTITPSGKTTARGAGNSGEATSGFSIHAAPGGSSYHVVFNGKWKYFSGEEMLAMVRAARAQGDTAAGAVALYQWLKRERLDFLQDLSIRDSSGGLMLELTALIRKSFRIKS